MTTIWALDAKSPERWIVAREKDVPDSASRSGGADWSSAHGSDRSAIRKSSFLKNVMHVVFHGTGRDAQAIRDSFVAESLGNELRDFALAWGQQRQSRVRDVIVTRGRNPKNDRRITELARGFQVDRHARSRGSHGCQIEQFRDRQRMLRGFVEPSDSFAQELQRIAIESGEMAGHASAQYGQYRSTAEGS